MRRTQAALAVFAAIFVAYVGLLPYEFQTPAAPFGLWDLRDLPFKGWVSIVREDGLAHLLAYCLLAILVRAALGTSPRGGWSDFAKDVLAGAACAALAAGLEFLQQYLPARGASLSDLVAGLIGIAVGLLVHRWLAQAYPALSVTLHRGPPSERLRLIFTLYVAMYFLGSLFPYDFPLSADEFAHLMGSDRHAWLWSKDYCGGLVSCAVRLGAEIALAIPVGIWLVLRSQPARLGTMAAAAAGLVIGAAIEGAQLMLLSATSQGLSVVTRALGVALGAGAGRWLQSGGFERSRPALRPLVALGLPPYLFAIAAVDGWFRGPWQGMQEAAAKLVMVNFLPFYYHYEVSETGAVASLAVQSLLFVPVGVGVWLWQFPGVCRFRGGGIVAGMFASLLAGVAEAGKLFVADAHPDPTDLLIAFASATAAYHLCEWVVAGRHAGTAIAHPASPDHEIANGPLAHSEPSPRRALPGWLRKTVAATLLVGMVWGASAYPLGPGLVFPILLLAGVSVWYRPQWAPAIALAALPIFNLAPWSGWFFFDEFDLLLACVIAVGYLRSPCVSVVASVGLSGTFLLGLTAVAWLAAGVAGLLPVAPLDQNALSSYFSPYNALRVGKGIVWALLLAPLLLDWRTGRADVRPITFGMVFGLSAAGLAAVWERFLFAGLFNFSNEYRITGTFSGVHTGGAFVEAYLAAAIPFALLLALRVRRMPAILIAGAAFLGGCYGVLVTYARAGYLALAVALGVFVVGILLPRMRGRPSGTKPLVLAGSITVAVLALGIPIVFGSYATSRFATLEEDAGTRLRHWREAVRMMDRDLPTHLLGMGLGTFPRTYLVRNPERALPTTYRFIDENGNHFLRLGSGELLYFAQRVRIDPGAQYRLQVDLRGNGKDGDLTVPICEKFILHSFECKWITVEGRGSNGHWRRYEISFDAGQIGAPLGRFQVRRPTQLAMFNGTSGTVIDVDNVSLFDVSGNNLVANGDFERGMDRWFFSTDSHLPWHTKNLAVQIYFEQGVLGLLAFVLLTGIALFRAISGALRGDEMALAVLASLAAFLSLGLFDSLFDEPRLSFLYFTLVVIALARRPTDPVRT